MQRAFVPAAVLCALMFGVAPFLVVGAPYESTMGLVQKIFYYHAPAGMTMFLAAFVSGIASGVYLFRGSRTGDRIAAAAAELVVLFGVHGLPGLFGHGKSPAFESWDDMPSVFPDRFAAHPK